jgi:opacity protein-like surface antigen
MGGEWMIGKFAAASVLTLILTILLVPRAVSQATPPAQPSTPPDTSSQQPAPAQQPAQPAGQQPAAQPPSGQQAGQQTASDQELADEESTLSRRKLKPREFNKWDYNAGVGVNLDSGTTKTYVRGGGYNGTVGVARNANKYLGLRGDFFFADLPLRQSSLDLAQAQSASSYFFALMLDPIINIPVTKTWGGYILFGPGYYHRWGNLSSDTAVPGSSCNGFFEWWGVCPNVSIPISGSFVHSDQNQFGYNVGAGITRKMPSGVEVYAEYRLTHGSANGTTTDVRPITIGVRW